MSYKQAKKVTLVSAFCNATLAIAKMVVGVISGSHGIFADGLHSASDLLTDFLVIVASKYGSQAADQRHPYGHKRIETAATFFLSLLLVVTGAAIIFEAYQHIYFDDKILDGSIAIAVIIASLVVNEALYQYTLYHGKRLKSQLLIANAWHHRSDSLSSFVVLIGVVANLFGFYYFDVLSAFIVGLLIINMGWSIGWNSMRELVDTSIEEDKLKKIASAIKQTPGVVAIHQLRTRSMAGMVLVDVHVLVTPQLSVSEGHYIGQHVGLNIRQAEKAVNDVTVHIDPEDDEIANPSINLPARQNLLPELMEYWQGLVSEKEILRVDFHYLDGSIIVDCFFIKGTQIDIPRCRAAILAHQYITDVNLFKEMS